MNREIKFRAWDTHKNKMFNVGVLGIFDNCSWQHGFNHLHNTQDWYGEEGMVVKPILMQFTGLHDKNGKEIYEGDIVQNDAWDYPFKVIFNNEKARFVCELKTGLTQYIHSEGLIVIGNIYENPELLNPTQP